MSLPVCVRWGLALRGSGPCWACCLNLELLAALGLCLEMPLERGVPESESSVWNSTRRLDMLVFGVSALPSSSE